MLKKIFKILTRWQVMSLVLMMVLQFIGGIFDLLGVSLILPIVNVLMDEQSLSNKKWAIIICNIFNIETTRGLVIFLLAAIILVYVIKNVYVLVRYWLLYDVTYRFKKALSMRLMRCYMYQDYTFHLENNVAELHRNVVTDIGQFYGFITNILNLLNQAITCIFVGVYLIMIDWKTSVCVIVVLGTFLLIVYNIQKKSQLKLGMENREASAQSNKWMLQSFNGIKEIQVLGREEYFLKHCEEAYDRGMEINKRSNFAALVPKPVVEITCVCGLLGIIMVRIILGADLTSFVSVLAVFAVAAFKLLPSFNSISALISTMLFEKDSVERVYEDITEMEQLGERKRYLKSKDDIPFEKSITINNLTYKYPKTDVIILDDVSFEIKKNQSVGFMGKTGAGKSTLIDVIMGVLPIEHGSVCVDGRNIVDNMDAWHRLVGYIPQSIYLMDDTIRNNVAFGIPDDEISQEQIWRALEEAQIADFVRELPDGIDSMIGEHGVRISGGQRQRLGIARALYHNPPVLVFDEATSALDNDTEHALMEAIDGLKGTRTMLIIAHRLHTIENCDVVYEVKGGKVVVRENIYGDN